MDLINIIFIFSNLTAEQKSDARALIKFSVKDFKYFGLKNGYIGECFLMIKDIIGSNAEEQFHLKLNRPNYCGRHFKFNYNVNKFQKFNEIFAETDSMRIMELRSEDKEIQKFLKQISNRTK